MENNHSFSSTLGFKLVTSLLACLTVACSLTFILGILPQKIWELLNYNLVLLLLLCGVLLGGTALGVLWKEKETEDHHKSKLWQACLLGVIRYSLAFIISTYGFAKILKTQFSIADFLKDIPLGEVSGFYLTWYYFGYSYTLAVIIALLQIGGAILLLFRRTTLMGTMVLLPVMVNIVLINMFYSINIGAFIVSVLITLTLFYLLLLDYQKLKAAFWVLADQLPSIRTGSVWIKPLFRLLPILAAFGIIYQFILRDTSDKQLLGRWRVKKFIRNGTLLSEDAWLTDKTVYSKIYFSGMYGCVFSTNPYVYDPTLSLQGQYSFDEGQNQLQFVYYANGQLDTLRAYISDRTPHAMNLEGILNKDTLRMELTKIDRIR